MSDGGFCFGVVWDGERGVVDGIGVHGQGAGTG